VKKRALTYLKLYPDDTIAHRVQSGESMTVFGARVYLWCISTRETPPGTLPNCPKKVAKWVGLDPKRFRKLWPKLTENWRLDAESNRWIIRRISEQVQTYEEISAKRAAAGRKGGASNCLANDTSNCLANDFQFAKHTSPVHSLRVKRREEEELLEDTSDSNASSSAAKSARSDPSIDWGKDRIPDWADRLRARWPDQAADIDRMIKALLKSRPPFSVVEAAWQSALDHDADRVVPYVTKILAVEVQNHHERSAIAEHEARKEGAAINARGMQAIRDVLASIGGG